MIDLCDVYDVIFYDKDGNKLFKFDRVDSLNIDMRAGEVMEFDCHIISYEFDIYEPHNITVPINEIDMNTEECNKPVKAVFENLDQDKLDQEKKECYDYYFGDTYWKKNNPDKPIFTEKVNEFEELLGGDTEWLL